MEGEEIKTTESAGGEKTEPIKKRASGEKKKTDGDKRLETALKKIDAERKELANVRKELEAERALLAEERARRERIREELEHAEYTEKLKNVLMYVFIGVLALVWIIWGIVITCRFR